MNIFKKINKVYDEVFYRKWSEGSIFSRIDDLFKLINAKDEKISKLNDSIKLIKDYLGIIEETITSEEIPTKSCFNLLTGERVGGGSITRLVKKTKSKKNK